MVLRANAERLLGDLRKLSEFGKCGSGVRRTALSEEDIAARLWLADKFRIAGLSPGMDAVGNVFGRSPHCDKAILVGSHTDSVPSGGWLDGSLGVIFGLEIARRLHEENLIDQVGVDVVSFQDEEGTFVGYLGSRFASGELTDEQITGAKDVNGTLLKDALKRLPPPFGGSFDLARYLHYFESHIEQGPVLEQSRLAVGVVRSIVGIRTVIVKFHGRADHAGTTPMAMREDAAEQMFNFAVAMRSGLKAIGTEGVVWNFGNAQFLPGASNVVPSNVELSIQYRAAESAVLQKIDSLLERTMADVSSPPRAVQAITVMRSEPVHFDEGALLEIEAAAAALGMNSIRMASGAGHDAQILNRHVPSSMMFIPSVGGRSHCFDEDTREEDILNGADVALNAVHRMIQHYRQERC